MVQISTIHDTELNQKVFRVRGDEGYLRESKVIIEEVANSITQYGLNYNINIKVTLKRGTGESHIAIIDNGVTINVVEWLPTDTVKTVTITGLTYDIDHNIQVRWLGSSRYLKSTSNTITLNKENDTYRSTELSLTTTGNVVDINDGGTLTFELEDVEDSSAIEPIEDGQIKIYIDGEYETVITTDSDGEASYDFSNANLSHGIRKISLFYEGGAVGSVYYRKSELEFDYSIGKKISITDYPSIFLNGGEYAQNNITAIVTDYFDTPLSGVTVSLSDDSVSDTTVSDGSVTICPTDITNGSSYYLKSGTSKSDSYTSKSATISGIDITASKTMITPNTNTQMTVQVSGTDIQKDIPITLNSSETLYTNDSGKVTINYTGVGYGDKVFAVSCADKNDSVTIEDLFFYYGTEIPNYAPMKTFSGSYSKQSNGLKINVASNGVKTMIGFGDANNKVYDWEMKFRVAYHDYNKNGTAPSGTKNGTAISYGSWTSSSATQPTNIPQSQATSNVYGLAWQNHTSDFRIKKEDGEINIYHKYSGESETHINIPPKGYYDNPTNDNPLLIANAWYNKNIQLVINNIKIKRINRS